MVLPKPYGEAMVSLYRRKEKLNSQNELVGLHHSVATQEVVLINFIHSMAGTGIRADNWASLAKGGANFNLNTKTQSRQHGCFKTVL